MEDELERDQHEVLGIALQRIGEIIANDKNAQLNFNEKYKMGKFDSSLRTTRLTLEVSGVEK